MESVKRKITVLYIDQAVFFGGSLVVLGYAVNSINRYKFRSLVIGELDVQMLKHFTRDDIQIYVVRKIFNYVKWAKATAKIKLIPGNLFRKFVIYLLSGMRSLLNLVYMMRVAIIIIKEKVDIIHINNGMDNLEPILVAMLLGRKFVVHFHGVENPGIVQRVLMKRVPRFVVISEYLKNALVEKGLPADKMVVIANPVQEKEVAIDEVIQLRKTYGLGDKDRVFGIVGRVVRWKGHVEFLRAAMSVLAAVPNAKVLIIGDFTDSDTSYQDQIFEMVEKSGFKDRILFTGFVKNVEQYYSVLDVCVHTSIEPEPFGLVITEAMSHGVPVIASDLGAPKEIITNGENGYIVSPAATEKLAKTIIKLLADDRLRKRIGESGRQHVEANFQLESYGHSIENLYLGVLGSRE